MVVHAVFDGRSVRASTDTSARIVDLVTCSGHESSSLELAGSLDKVRKMPQKMERHLQVQRQPSSLP